MTRNPQPKRLSPAAGALVYCAALFAGVVIVVFGHRTPVEASGFVSPFVVVLQEAKSRIPGGDGPEERGQ